MSVHFLKLLSMSSYLNKKTKLTPCWFSSWTTRCRLHKFNDSSSKPFKQNWFFKSFNVDLLIHRNMTYCKHIMSFLHPLQNHSFQQTKQKSSQMLKQINTPYDTVARLPLQFFQTQANDIKEVLHANFAARGSILHFDNTDTNCSSTNIFRTSRIEPKELGHH